MAGFNASNKPNTCLWCGRRLRIYILDRKPRNATSALYTEAAQELDRLREVSRQKRVAENGPRRGDYGEGFFCGLRCGFDFAVAMATHGKRLAPPDTEVPA